jgi:3-methyladenine DNA glycosylase/8-oxoguanine DNA glycosylase
VDFEIKVALPYHFRGSVHDHGWIQLAPNRWDEESATFWRVEKLTGGQVVLLEINGIAQPDCHSIKVQIHSDNPTSEDELAEIQNRVRWIMRLDEDFSELYRLCENCPEDLEKMAGRGRLLRSSTLFEDAVKTICTTNTTWAQTIGMVRRLVETLGEPYPPEPQLKAFPTPERIAEAGADFLKQTVRLGYRAPYVLQLASEVALGERHLEQLRQNKLPVADLKKALKSIKGLGEYSVHTLLMCLGYYEELAIDSIMRGYVSKTYYEGQPVDDKTIRSVFEKWGKWKYLAYWFELK